MATKTKYRGTLVDHLVGAIVPVLIMVMVGSLTFFLLDLWYQGPFLERLRWILFWFVFGIVLITRIGMQIGEVAKGYGAALGGAVALVATSFAGFQPFLLGVMALVWWATHHLTYDCTLVDENQDAGVGLLQESGLAAEELAAKTAQEPEDLTADPDRMDASLLSPARPWWKVWGSREDTARRPHGPGVWLIYFAMASLPAFGIGQWLVPAVDEERRSGLLFYVIAYIASAMGLLLATSFLNLRRYLRKRKIPMPKAMTATWLTTGAMVIAALTVFSAALLPAIAGVRSITGSAVSSSSSHRASRWAMNKDSGVQGDGAESEGKAASKSEEPQNESGEEQGSGKTNDPNASKQTSGKGREGGKNQPGNAKSGAAKGKSSAKAKGNASGKQGQQNDNAKDAGKDQGKSDSQSEPSQQKDESQGKDQKAADDQESSDEQNRDQSQNSSSNSSPNTPSLSFTTPSWLRIPILIIGGCFLLYGAFRYGPELIRGFMAFLAALFNGLWFGRPRPEREREEGEPATKSMEPPRPFSSFANPFDVGMDRQFTPNDLIIYSFQALESWAYEAGMGRQEHETPIEFARRIGAVQSDLNAEANRLVAIYTPITYGRRIMKPEALQHLRVFWRTLEAQGVPATAR